jgi:hypothetical protein
MFYLIIIIIENLRSRGTKTGLITGT